MTKVPDRAHPNSMQSLAYSLSTCIFAREMTNTLCTEHANHLRRSNASKSEYGSARYGPNLPFRDNQVGSGTRHQAHDPATRGNFADTGIDRRVLPQRHINLI
jgi:hypothetical protein